MSYKLIVEETKNKNARFRYKVVDASGAVVTERSSNRIYVACTVDGDYFFGRLDLVGKGGSRFSKSPIAYR